MPDYKEELRKLLATNNDQESQQPQVQEQLQQKDDRLDYALILDNLRGDNKYSSILRGIKSDERANEELKFRNRQALKQDQIQNRKLQMAEDSMEYAREEALQRLAQAKVKKAEKDAELLKKIEERKASKKDSEDFRRRNADESKYSKFMQQLAVTGRGTTFARNLREDINQSEIALNRIESIEKGELIGDKQTAVDISNSVSRLIAGGHPAIQLVDATLYKSLGGEANDWAQWVSGHPQEYINSIQLDQIKGQILNIRDTKRKQYDGWESDLKGSINYILDRNPDLKKEFELFHPKPMSKTEVKKELKPKSPPHGQRVRQAGITYVWDGEEYVQE